MFGPDRPSPTTSPALRPALSLRSSPLIPPQFHARFLRNLTSDDRVPGDETHGRCSTDARRRVLLLPRAPATEGPAPGGGGETDRTGTGAREEEDDGPFSLFFYFFSDVRF